TPKAAAEEDAGEERAVTGEECAARYLASADVTVILMEVQGVGVVAAPVNGDGWTIDCRREGLRLLVAKNEPEGRFANVFVDESATAVADLGAYAAAHGGAMARFMEENGLTDVRMAEPTVFAEENAFVILLGANADEVRFGQLNAFRLEPTPVGLLRFHIAEVGDAQSLQDHAESLVEMAVRFGLVGDGE